MLKTGGVPDSISGYSIDALGDKLALLPTSAIENVADEGTTSTPARGRINFTGAAVVTDNAGANSKDVAISGYTLQFSCGAGSPADASTYFIGSSGVVLTGITASGAARVYVPKTGTIKAIYGNVGVGGTLGDAATSTLSLRLNNTTDTTISSAITANAVANPFSLTGQSIAVVAGDYLELKWVAPTWSTTNPTNVIIACAVYIE